MSLATAIRVFVLIILICAFAVMPPWQRSAPKPPPTGFGAAVGYGLGEEHELDALGTVWYSNYDFHGAPLGQHQRFFLVGTHADLSQVPSVARLYRGEWWQFGNEPNDPNQDNVSPAEYARRFHDFYFTLKTADPVAQIVPAGIADANWQWGDAFRESYRKEFGRYPTVDGWNIHNYLLDTCEGAPDARAFQSRIIAFREWMARIGEAAKPLFLTEYGVLYGNGCCGCPLIPPEQVVDYMRATTQWLGETQWVKGWAWFALRTDGRFNGDLFTATWRLTEFGETYRDLSQASAPLNKGGKWNEAR